MDLVSGKSKLIFNEVHDQLLDNEPWGAVKDGKFTSKVFFDVDLSTGRDVAVYEFNVNILVENFLDFNSARDSRFLQGEGIEDAKVIIADLKSMVARLEEALPTK